MSEIDEDNNLLDFARAGELEPFKELFAAPDGVDRYLAERDEYTQATPLHMAAANGHFEVLKYIIEHLPEGGVRKKAVNAVNDSGNSPMHWAALTGSLESVKLLHAAGADPLLKNHAGFDSCYQADAAGQNEVANFLYSVADIDQAEAEDEPTRG